jgi:tetratricopeptide (TPR) repeat protein
MTRFVFLFSVFLIILCVGCDQHKPATETVHEDPAKKTSPLPVGSDSHSPLEAVLLPDPVELALYETSSQALQRWYDLRTIRPALLLYSKDPLLQVASTAILNNLMSVLASHDESALRFDSVDTAIFPAMTVDVAMRSSMFSAVYWMLPTSAEVTDLSVETFRSQLVQSGALSSKEAESITLRNGVFSGKVRGFPFYAVHPNADLDINGPVAIHFDLSYLAALYEGEFKTPTYSLIYQVLKRLRDYQIETVSASFSYSQINRQIPLGSRFVGNVFKQLFLTPKLLDERLPEDWQMRANALYLPNMMIVEETRKVLLQLAQKHPNDASLHFALYQISRESRSTRDVALRHLADAVQRDPVYAYEYLILAPLARDKNRPDEALRVLLLANKALPNNPLITLELARGYMAHGQTDKAAVLLQQLLSLNWSENLHPGMPILLEEMLTEAKQ